MTQHRKKGLRLFGLYFCTLFSASMFLNATLLPSQSKAIVSQEELLQAAIPQAQAQASLELAHPDMTGIKAIVKRQRRQNERRRLQMEEQAWRNEQRKMARAAAATHPSAKKKSSFVPFDSELAVIPAKVKAGGLSEAEREQIRNQIPAIAQQYLGVPYVYGGKTPRGFDCSGYTSYVMGKFGIGITGSSRHQALLGRAVNVREVKTGDLIFFSRYGKGGRVTHVALVLENNDGKVKVIHANGPGIMTEDLFSSKYWVPKILFARDLIGSI